MAINAYGMAQQAMIYAYYILVRSSHEVDFLASVNETGADYNIAYEVGCLNGNR